MDCGYIKDHPEADIVQGQDYQTGYFVNGKKVQNRDSIIQEVNQQKEDQENVFTLASDTNRVDSSTVDIQEEIKDPEERVSDVELKARITGIEHISEFEFPSKRFCEK